MLLKRGNNNDKNAVIKVQKFLGLVADGIYGVKTEQAVREWQHIRGINPVDGIVGNVTYAAMFPSEPKSGLKKSKRRIDEIIVHCTATEEGKDYTVEWIRKIHKNKGWKDIGYNYVIYRDGSIHEGRDVDMTGAHAKNHNAHSIGVVYIGGCPKGDTHKNKDTRTDAQKAAMLDLLKRLRKLYPTAKILGHKDVNATGCPSFNAKDEYKDI